MIRPDMIVLVIDFKGGRNLYKELKTAKELIQKTDGGEGIIENTVNNILGDKVIAHYKYSVTKCPVSSPIGVLNSAVGAIGIFAFIGSVEKFDKTIEIIKDIMKKSNFEHVEIYTADEVRDSIYRNK